MVYDTKELEQRALKILRENEIVTTIENLASRMGISKVTLYSHGLNELNTIKEAIEKNKIDIKETLRQKWLVSDNPTLQIAVYKLLAEDDEYLKLANAKGELKHSGNVGLYKSNEFEEQIKVDEESKTLLKRLYERQKTIRDTSQD